MATDPFSAADISMTLKWYIVSDYSTNLQSVRRSRLTSVRCTILEFETCSASLLLLLVENSSYQISVVPALTVRIFNLLVAGSNSIVRPLDPPVSSAIIGIDNRFNSALTASTFRGPMRKVSLEPN